MLLKWLFTLLAMLWLIQALKPYFGVQPGSDFHTPPPQPPPPNQNPPDNGGEYIDYEEVK